MDNCHELMKQAWNDYPSQDNEGFQPDRGGFKCGWFMAWHHQQKHINQLEAENKNLGEGLVASVCKECKCENIVEHNGAVGKRKLELEDLCKIKDKQIREKDRLLLDIYDYLDVENEGVSKEVYKLVERIRKSVGI